MANKPQSLVSYSSTYSREPDKNSISTAKTKVFISLFAKYDSCLKNGWTEELLLPLMSANANLIDVLCYCCTKSKHLASLLCWCINTHSTKATREIFLYDNCNSLSVKLILLLQKQVIPCGQVVRIRRSHCRARGLIPRMGVFFSRPVYN